LGSVEDDWADVARDLVRRRFGDAGLLDIAQRRKAADLLLRRGFSMEHVRAATRHD
jgi:regulatory protein